MIAEPTSTDSAVLAPLRLGLGLTALVLAVTVVGGFYATREADGDGTLDATFVAFVCTAPYFLLAGLGVVVYHIKRWRPLAYVFNLATVVELATWLYLNVLSRNGSDSLAYHLSHTQTRTVVVSSIIAVVVAFLLIVMAKISPPDILQTPPH